MTAASKQAEQEQGNKRPTVAHRTTAQMSATPKCPGPSAPKDHCHSIVHEKPDEYAHTYTPVDENGVSGSGEELSQTLEKVVSQLEIISRTLHVLEQRVSMNEDSVTGVMDYFRDCKESERNAQLQVMQFNP